MIKKTLSEKDSKRLTEIMVPIMDEINKELNEQNKLIEIEDTKRLKKWYEKLQKQQDKISLANAKKNDISTSEYFKGKD